MGCGCGTRKIKQTTVETKKEVVKRTNTNSPVSRRRIIKRPANY